jgi:prevent-host-death family protein
MPLRMGLREANQRFSRAMKAVRAGQEVVLTERGKPIAIIKPLWRAEDRETALQPLVAAGLLRPASKRGATPRWIPRPMAGRPITDTLREDREAGR